MNSFGNIPKQYFTLFKNNAKYISENSKIKIGDIVDNVVLSISHSDDDEKGFNRIYPIICEYSPYIIRNGKDMTIVSFVSVVRFSNDDLFSFSIKCAKQLYKVNGIFAGVHYQKMMVIKNDKTPDMAAFSQDDLKLGFVLGDAAKRIKCKLLFTGNFVQRYPKKLLLKYMDKLVLEGDNEYKLFKYRAFNFGSIGV